MHKLEEILLPILRNNLESSCFFFNFNDLRDIWNLVRYETVYQKKTVRNLLNLMAVYLWIRLGIH